MDVTMEQQRQFEKDLERLTANIGHMNTMLEHMGESVGRLDSRIAILEALDERHSQLCPYKVDIERSKNNREAIKKNADDIKELSDMVTGQRILTAGHAATLSSLSALAGGIISGLISRFFGG